MNTNTLSTDRLHPALRRALRVILGLAVLVGLTLLALVLLFVAAVTYSGCFMSCSEPDPVGGILVLIGATAAATSALLSGAWGLTTWPAKRVLRLAPGTAAGLFAIGFYVVSITS
jgi:hypothetical protein